MIRSRDVVFNEDYILLQNQRKIVGKWVSFDITKDSVEGPAHYTKRTEENEAKADPDTENGPLAELEDKVIKDKTELTHIVGVVVVCVAKSRLWEFE